MKDMGILIVGSGAAGLSEERLRIMAEEMSKKGGVEIIVVNDEKEGTTLTVSNIKDALELLKPNPEKLKEEMRAGVKPFEPEPIIIKAPPFVEPLKPYFPSGSPINAITTHKKKGKYRP